MFANLLLLIKAVRVVGLGVVVNYIVLHCSSAKVFILFNYDFFDIQGLYGMCWSSAVFMLLSNWVCMAW